MGEADVSSDAPGDVACLHCTYAVETMRSRDDPTRVLTCHRFPPPTAMTMYPVWPEVGSSDWCGEYRSKKA